MKARITKDPCWIVNYKGRKLQIAVDAVVNGNLAYEAISEMAAVAAPNSAKVTPMILHKPAPKRKKALGAAPENKAEF